LVRGRKWHASQEFQELPGGGSRLRLRLNNIEEIEGWILSWGAHATVVRPKALAQRLQKIAREVLAKYGEA
jgi:predicted DNA-binding transcriptional regulator YafY